ncbi:uncharacterized protein N7496_004008 [Penicillium cataractarum]|uniref:Uncharacterized protein n=1 Tax=Penicillium cataractarum TaxID=2100454 RepID=A0A9W9VJD5_9EURO|nr:uncharacterized protein N7496_004008 [Penicillium cataractarum]KAJ5381580.1 hypothetical protein N7496_004008 [Penicillium cataractarum]
MSSDLSHSSIPLHSNASLESHETVASSPLNSAIPANSSKNRFHSLPSHRRSNTEYIARPPIFEDSVYDSTSSNHLSKNRAAPAWTDTFPKKKLEARARILSDWFQGKSESGDSGHSMRPDSHPNGAGMEASRVRAGSPSHMRKNSAPGTGRFSFFGLRRPAEQRLDFPEPADDEFLNLDISAALSTPDSDLSSDEALDSLRDQATTVLQRMQEAYKQRTFAMHQVLADRNEKHEELEETRARVDHLKMQLDGMAAKVLDQEKAMKAMAEELEQERHLRQREESCSRSRTMRTIPPEDEIPSLVLQTPHRGGKRTSHGTFTSDSGFESGDESVADSVFSHKEIVESPTSTLTAPSPSLSQVALSAPSSLPTIQKNLVAATTNPAPARSSTYERVIKGIASTRLGSSFVGNANNCNICHGIPASEAWSVMGVLKDENRGLKTRLGELELVIDDCLGLVGP